LATRDVGRKLWAVPLLGGELGPHQTKCRLGEVYLGTKWYPDASSRLVTIDMGQKLGAVPPSFFWGGAGSPSNTMSPGLRPTSVQSGIFIHPTVWPQRTWAEDWGLCPFLGELGPHPTQCGRGQGLPTSKFHLDPSNRLATLHQRHRQEDKRTGQRSDSIGRTVLQTVA